MAILETEAVQLSNAVRDAMVALRTLVNGNQLTNNLLETTDKTDLVSAVNELKASIDALSYDDLADLPTIPATVAELTDATTYDTLNTPVADADAQHSRFRMRWRRRQPHRIRHRHGGGFGFRTDWKDLLFGESSYGGSKWRDNI
jgi:hypothetical protein